MPSSMLLPILISSFCFIQAQRTSSSSSVVSTTILSTSTGSTSNTTGSTTSVPVECHDSSSFCAKYLSIGLCDSILYEQLMLTHCKKTCNMCEMVECEDKAESKLDPQPSAPFSSSTQDQDRDMLTNSNRSGISSTTIDPKRHRFPYSVVWTPLPLISWFIPVIGHMGIANSKGVIRDFAGSYYVAEDNMGFGWPTRYWQLDVSLVDGGADSFDRAIRDASDEYKCHTHNIFCDNCHSHVALALNFMAYKGRTNWNMVNLAFYILFSGKYVGVGGCLKQWLPFMILVLISVIFICIRFVF